MSTKPPDLGPAGSGELDNPAEPPGLGPSASGTLDDGFPLSPPHEPQPVAGGVRQDIGIGGTPGAQPGDRPGAERRVRQEDPDRWRRDERRSEPFSYGDTPDGGSTRH